MGSYLLEIAAINARIRDLGDRKAIESTKASLDAQIDVLRKEAALNDADIAAFEALAATFRTMDARAAEIEEAMVKLAPFVDADSDSTSAITPNVSVEIQLRPHTDQVGRNVGERLEQEVALAREALLGKVAGILIAHREALVAERAS